MRSVIALLTLIVGVVTLQACATASGESPKDGQAAASAPAATPGAQAPVEVSTHAVVQRPIVRTLRVTGSLIADEQAEVSAETNGRVVKTPIERGSQVGTGALLVQIAADQTSAQMEEARANAARIAAGLALDPKDESGSNLDIERVPNVANAKAELTLAEADFARFRSLLEQRVVSQAEFDQQRTRVEAARQRYEAARNEAHQEFRGLEAARARVALARKSLGDTTVRAPFAGVVVERKVSVGDYVTTGMQVATVVRINPLRVLLTVPEQSVGLVKVGQPVGLQVDAYPNRTFTGTVRFVSPSLRSDQRALTVEAILPNPAGELKPGFFATAYIEQPEKAPALLIDRRAVREVGKTRRVFVVAPGDSVQERIVTLGQTVDSFVEVVSGVAAGERVAIGGASLVDGAKVRIRASDTPPVPIAAAPPVAAATRGTTAASK